MVSIFGLCYVYNVFIWFGDCFLTSDKVVLMDFKIKWFFFIQMGLELLFQAAGEF